MKAFIFVLLMFVSINYSYAEDIQLINDENNSTVLKAEISAESITEIPALGMVVIIKPRIDLLDGAIIFGQSTFPIFLNFPIKVCSLFGYKGGVVGRLFGKIGSGRALMFTGNGNPFFYEINWTISYEQELSCELKD